MPPNQVNEQTPLLVVVNVPVRHQRYHHHRIRRCCSCCLGTALISVVILILFPTLFEGPWSAYIPWADPLPHDQWPFSQGLNYTEVQQIILTTPSEKKAKEWSSYYTAGPHLAGKNLSQALWTRERWGEFGVASSIAAYDVYINYPVDHRLALLEGSKNKSGTNAAAKKEYTVKYECSLEEDVLEEDSTTGLKNRIPTFHGYSANGNVTAPYVYVNFGTYQDFEDLVAANVSLEGKIALAKYGHVFRGLKVKRAQEMGMVGIVIYSDPQEDGEMTEENGHKPYPKGPARNPSAVQRGSAQFLSVAPGDPTTPGYPSKPGVPRVDPHGTTPSIPSLPISYADALPLLKALNGYGPNASAFGDRWEGGGLKYKGVKYNIGPSPDDVVLNLYNEQEYTTTPLWNVIGVINGTVADEVVILGNHRDAWIAGGAVDPNSGSAAMNELIRSFGLALEAGWKPLRTIVFCSWDGEEYGLIGSTEWVEEYLPWIRKATVAYLNVDVATGGPNFKSSASPLLNKAIYEATSLVPSPNQTVKGQTIRDVWNGHIGTMGSGSDFTAFQDYAGVPSVDMGFSRSANDPVYHYHSNYDSFHWMDKFGDPRWQYHTTVTKLWGLLALNLIESPLISLNATDYAHGLRIYLESVKSKAENSTLALSSTTFTALEKSIHKLAKTSREFDAYTEFLSAHLNDDVPWWKWWLKVRLYYQIRAANLKYKMLERQFLYEEGLDGRSWFKHVVFAPGLWTGYSGATFPGLVEALDAGNLTNAERWSKIIKGKIDDATELLK